MKKTKTQSPVRSGRTKKAKKYPSYLLGLALVMMLVSEGSLVTHATSADWQAGLSVLDVSTSVSALPSEMAYVAEPAVFAFDSITEFYNQAAIAITPMMDISGTNSTTLAFFEGADNFYQVAVTEMANVLDISNYTTSFQPKVAGVSISK